MHDVLQIGLQEQSRPDRPTVVELEDSLEALNTRGRRLELFRSAKIAAVGAVDGSESNEVLRTAPRRAVHHQSRIEEVWDRVDALIRRGHNAQRCTRSCVHARDRRPAGPGRQSAGTA